MIYPAFREQTQRRPLVCYTNDCNQRAILVSAVTARAAATTGKNMAGVRKSQRRTTSFRGRNGRRRRRAAAGRHRRRRGGFGASKVRIVKGKISIRVAGFPGFQRIGASQLVRFVPLAKLRVAAKRALGAHRGGNNRRRKGRRTRRRPARLSSSAAMLGL
jgi:hypothetical protein